MNSMKFLFFLFVVVIITDRQKYIFVAKSAGKRLPSGCSTDPVDAHSGMMKRLRHHV